MRKAKKSTRRLCLFGNWYRPDKQYWESAPDWDMAMLMLFKDFIGPALKEEFSRSSAIWERFSRLTRPTKIHVG